MTQAAVAALLKTTQQTYARWEGGKIDPPTAALRDLSLMFETSVDYILGRDESRPATSRYYILANDADGFWGHLGLHLPGNEKTSWFPITYGVANRLRGHLKIGAGAPDWLIAQTLDNHVLVFQPAKMERIWLLDDACDGPQDDWEWNAPLTGETGLPLEIYRAMRDWAEDQVCDVRDFEENNSED